MLLLLFSGESEEGSLLEPILETERVGQVLFAFADRGRVSEPGEPFIHGAHGGILFLVLFKIELIVLEFDVQFLGETLCDAVGILLIGGQLERESIKVCGIQEGLTGETTDIGGADQLQILVSGEWKGESPLVHQFIAVLLETEIVHEVGGSNDEMSDSTAFEVVLDVHFVLETGNVDFLRTGHR